MQADYTRYGGQHLAAALSLPLMEAAGQGLQERLPAYLRPKCAALLLDASLCSPAVVRLNIYQAAPPPFHPPPPPPPPSPPWRVCSVLMHMMRIMGSLCKPI